LGEKLSQGIGYINPGDSKETAVWVRSDVNFPAGEYRIVTVVDGSACNDLGEAFVVDSSQLTFTQGGSTEVAPIVQTDAKAIARWDVVPFQTFSGTMNVGIVAFHINGISKVDFEIGGKTYTVTEATLNPQ